MHMNVAKSLIVQAERRSSFMLRNFRTAK